MGVHARLAIGTGSTAKLKILSALRKTAPLVASGMIRVPIAATYRLTPFREAVAHVQRGGKVMVDVDGAI